MKIYNATQIQNDIKNEKGALYIKIFKLKVLVEILTCSRFLRSFDRKKVFCSTAGVRIYCTAGDFRINSPSKDFSVRLGESSFSGPTEMYFEQWFDRNRTESTELHTWLTVDADWSKILNMILMLVLKMIP